MKCISLWQPWSTLLVSGAKRVETRSFPITYRGPLLIHAAKAWNSDLAQICREAPFPDALKACFPGMETCHDAKKHLPFGAIVGQVELAGCWTTGDVKDYPEGLPDVGAFVDAKGLHVSRVERDLGDFSPNRFAWLCLNPVRFKTPIPYRGELGLFEVSDKLVNHCLESERTPTSN